MPCADPEVMQWLGGVMTREQADQRIDRVEPCRTPRRQDAGKESAAVLGFSSAMGAFGAFFIPKSFGTSMAATGSPAMAFYMFVGFYLSCIVVTWWWYARKGCATPC